MDRVLPSVPFNNACKANRRKCREGDKVKCSLLGLRAEFYGAVHHIQQSLVL